MPILHGIVGRRRPRVLSVHLLGGMGEWLVGAGSCAQVGEVRTPGRV